MPKMFARDSGGTVREASKVFVNDSGTVREATKVFTLDSNTVRLIFELISGLEPVTGTPINGLDNVQNLRVSDIPGIVPGSAVFIPAGFWAWSDDITMGGLIVDVNDVTIINAGNIIGRGGDASGGDGGPAIMIEATGVTVQNNGSGFIAGGGGGGGNTGLIDVGRATSAGGGGGAGGGSGANGSGSTNANFRAGGSIGQAGGGGAEAGAGGGLGTAAGGSGGGRILPGNAISGNGGTAGNVGGTGGHAQAGGGGGWGAKGGTGGNSGTEGGDGGLAIESSKIYNGVSSNSGTVYGTVAPLIGSDGTINELLNHREISLSGLGVQDGDTITIPENFYIWSDDTAVPALTADVPNVTIINNGFIMGRGGNGNVFNDGGDGGPAISVATSGITIQNNSTGFIAGGGGGGNGTIINSNRGQYGGGGGGAGGGIGSNGGSNPRGSGAFRQGGSIGRAGGAGSPNGGAGSSSSVGVGGGRILDGATGEDSVGFGPNGGGWGADGGDGSAARGDGGTGGSAIEGVMPVVVNNGTIYGFQRYSFGISGFAGQSVAGNANTSGATGTMDIPAGTTIPAGASWTIGMNSSGLGRPIMIGSILFNGSTVASFQGGVGGTPGNFRQTQSLSSTGTITGGPYTDPVGTVSVIGSAVSSTSSGVTTASIGMSGSVAWVEEI